jgi:hypothetical protein
VNCTVAADVAEDELELLDALSDALEPAAELEALDPHPAIPKTTAKHSATIIVVMIFRLLVDDFNCPICPSSS